MDRRLMSAPTKPVSPAFSVATAPSYDNLIALSLRHSVCCAGCITQERSGLGVRGQWDRTGCSQVKLFRSLTAEGTACSSADQGVACRGPHDGRTAPCVYRC